MNNIIISHLSKDYGNNRGVFDISFEVKEGEIFGFLGPNGAGKTTTIRHLMGFIKADKGSCKINDLDCFENANSIQRNIGYIPGEISLFDDMTGRQYLDFINKYRGDRDCSKKDELIKMFEINLDIKIKKMSKGMKQKIAIVSAFMHNPQILILDEPTSGLDPVMQKRFIDLIKKEKNEGKTILMSSHMFEEIEKTCDIVGIIKEGRIIELDRVSKIRKKHINKYIVQLENKEKAIKFAKDFDGKVIKKEPNKVEVSYRKPLEEIFLDYYGEKK